MNENRRPFGTWRAFIPVLSYYGVYYFALILASIAGMAAAAPGLLQGGSVPSYPELAQAIGSWLSLHQVELSTAVAVMMFPVIALFRWFDRREEEGRERRYRRVSLVYYLILIALGAAASVTFNGLLNLSGLMSAMSGDADLVQTALYQGQLIAELVGVGVIIPLMEEMLFRGLVQQRFRAMMNPLPAVICTAVIFALYHGNMLQGIYTFLLGMIFGYLMEQYHSIAAPATAHISANLVSVILTESGAAQRMLASDAAQVILTLSGCAVLIGTMWLIHRHVKPEQISRE